ncbi:hypothetical protein [Leisingera sp.]|nr:hypothetical protein [Leisingera sp.]
MIEACLIALATLVIVLYGQTRLEARAIRRNRSRSHQDGRALILSSRNP